MTKECPPFEVLSRFADGALAEAEEAPVLAHLGGCAACRAALSSIEEVDGLLTLALPPVAARRRFRLLRPALISVAAAFLFAVTLTVVLTLPSGNGGDTPVAVAEASPRTDLYPAKRPSKSSEPLFSGDKALGDWQKTESVSDIKPADASGRRVVSLTAHAGTRKHWGLMSWPHEFSVGDGIAVDVDYRVQKPQKGGRMQVLLHSGMNRDKTVLRWSVTADGETLEAQESRTKPVVLWSSKGGADLEWHNVKLLVTRSEVVLSRDGSEVSRKTHGLNLERVSLTVGSTTDKRSKESHETFECQVGRVDVLPQ